MGKCVFEPHHINNALCSKCCRDCSSDAHKFPSYTTDPAAAMSETDDSIIISMDGSDVRISARRQMTEFFSNAKTLELCAAKFAKKLFAK